MIDHDAITRFVIGVLEDGGIPIAQPMAYRRPLLRLVRNDRNDPPAPKGKDFAYHRRPSLTLVTTDTGVRP